LLQQLWNERKGRLSPPLSPENSENDESDDEGVVVDLVALSSPAAFSTLSDLSNTPPMHGPNLPKGEMMQQIAM
jgi:hypothetical protein